MNSFIVSFDVSPTGNNMEVYNAVVERIKAYGIWAHITSSCWALRTDATAVNVRDFLLAVMRQEDRLCVVQTAHVAAWSNPMCNNEWLRGNI